MSITQETLQQHLKRSGNLLLQKRKRPCNQCGRLRGSEPV